MGAPLSDGSAGPRRRFRAADLRWGVLLPFLIPFLDVESPFFLAAPGVLGLSAASAAACAFLLSRLAGPPGRSLWAWVILLVFVQGYYVKSYWFARIVQTPGFMLVNHELYWLSADQIAAGLVPITWAFCTFCVVAWVLLGPVPTEVATAEEPPPSDESRALSLIALATAVGFAAGAVQWYLGFGVMGVENDPLPLRLDTIIVRTRAELVPGLIYLGIWSVDRSRRWTTWAVAAGSLLLMAGLDTVLSTSRGSFARYGLPVLFLWLLTGRLTARRAAFVALTLLLTLALHPVASALRAQRMSESMVARGGEELDAADGSTLFTLGVLASRVGGAEGVWYVAGRMDEGVDAARVVDHLSGALPIHVYHTRAIVGLPAIVDFRSPGLLGGLMLLGGRAWWLWLLAGYAAAVRLGWGGLSRLRTAAVARSIAAMQCLLQSMEGTFQAQNVGSMLATILVVELAQRRFLGRRGPDGGRRALNGS